MTMTTTTATLPVLLFLILAATAAAGESPPSPPSAATTTINCPADALEGGGGCVNINTATAADLALLYRVGPVLAARIIEEREAGGPYAADGGHDLAERVRGIGAITACANQRVIRVGGGEPTTRTEPYTPPPAVLEFCRNEREAAACYDC